MRAFDLPKFRKGHTLPPQFRAVTLADGTLTYVNSLNSDIPLTYDGDPRGYFGPDMTVRHHTNGSGFRGPSFAQTKREGVRRVVIVGDSFTFGQGVKDNDVFAVRLERRLNEGKGDPSWEVVNLGVGGYNTRQEIALLRNVGLPLAPDAVILGYNVNDAEPPIFEFDVAKRKMTRRKDAPVSNRDEPRPPDAFPYNLRVAQVLWRIASIRRTQARTLEYYASLYREDAEGWKDTQTSLAEFGELCRDGRFTCLAVIFPLLTDLDERYPFGHIHARVGGILSGAGIPVIDLLPLMSGRAPSDLWVHPTDQHPNEAVHALVAEELFQRLASERDREIRPSPPPLP
ncbi:MAG: SGNH/GDSL hydrolase family protein [Magnetospirillum sp. WYHS-4]